MLIDSWRRRLARLIAPKTNKRLYESARANRLTSSWYSANNSADSELIGSLTTLRSRSRALCRDAPYAKRARVVVVNNVVGAGIGMQAQVRTTRDGLNDRINESIESAWSEWMRAENCHTGGRLHFHDLERMAMAQIFEAGEVFIRKHFRPFGDSRIPLALEIVEPERIAEEYEAPQGSEFVRMGVEVDGFGRPRAYWTKVLHPGEVRFRNAGPEDLQRIPADQMWHLCPITRWPQTRGEPWMHAAATRLNDMSGYSEAEIVAARGAASYMGVIESPDLPTGDTEASGQQQVTIEPGIVQHVAPGEKFSFIAPNRPNPNMDPFMRMMLREVAAGVGVSYESLSRDYSQSNYSSSRLALLDDRDLWRTLQQWFIRSFREPLHREWMRQAVLANAIPAVSREAYLLQPEKYSSVTFKPRGWSWVDPTKEVDAYKEAVRAGFMTVSDVISQTGMGRDIEDVMRERRRELDLMEQLEIETDTEVKEEPEGQPAPPVPPPAGDSDDDDDAEQDDTDETPTRSLRAIR